MGVWLLLSSAMAVTSGSAQEVEGGLTDEEHHALTCIIRASSSLDLEGDAGPLLFVDGEQVGRLVQAVEPCASNIAAYHVHFRRIEIVKPGAAAQVLGSRARAGVVRVDRGTGAGAWPPLAGW